ncbi:hypothetical protein [Nocardiopsis gilva]|uniref:hypothetical protein n=1 Tax=Nocardiopsis gilva TaxID=280236 RepID=UPI0012FDAD15|nr:hypothetical protein [Nocardiopsis gilva]
MRPTPWSAPCCSAGVTLLVTLGALAVCEPRRDPRGELLYAMPVPPVVVWLARLTFVVGIDLLVAMTASLLASTVLAAPVGPLEMIGSWLGAALLGAALAVFGSVWRSPMVGAGFGLSAWAVGVLGLGVVPLPISADASAAVVTVWSTNPATLGAAAALLTASTWLVTRPDRTLPED